MEHDPGADRGTGADGGPVGVPDDVADPTDLDELPSRRRSRTVVVVAACCMVALLVGAAAPLFTARRDAGRPRLTGWARSADGRALLVAVGWGDPADACSDVYLRDPADPTRTALRLWRSCGVTDASARFDGPSQVRITSDSRPDLSFATGFDVDPPRADAERCTVRCVEDPSVAAVAEAFDPPAPPPPPEEVPA